MHEAKQSHRPPFDMLCPQLQVCYGCTHNKCLFCDIFRNEPFEIATMEDIEAELDELAKVVAQNEHRLYLTGGNPFALPNHRLIPMLKRAKEKLPMITEFGGFARIADMKKKSDEDLRELREMGVNMITFGAEGGYDPALAYMQKDHTGSDIAEQGQRLHAAGIDFCFFYLTGMAGAGKWEENAIASAKAYSAANPNYILVVTITPTNTWPLRKEIEEGRWVPPTEEEFTKEIYTFIKHLDSDSYVNVSHDTDNIKFEGKMPQDKEKMLQLMEHTMPKMNYNSCRVIRNFIHHSTYWGPEGLSTPRQ